GLDKVRAADTLEVPRFNPVSLKGEVTQDARTLNGRLYVSPHNPAVLTRAPSPIATIDLVSDVRTGVGRADINTTNLSFTPEGLQPLDLTPAVAGVATRDVTGSLDFKGHFGWHKDGGDSGGVLTLNGIDFDGPLGQANGLRGEIHFTSLAPLASDAGQSVRVDRFVTLVPLTNIDSRLQFFADYVSLEQADITTPGGQIQLEPMDVPFDQTKGFKGAMRFEKLDFGQVLAATDMGRDMSFQGTVSGRVPFALTSTGTFSFDKGQLKGDGPGRVSVRRTALQGSAEGSATATPESGNLPVQAVQGSAIENMAYQALENLAYQNLEASISTLDNGRLGFNFRITGKYDPPEKKEARIGIIDYIKGTWANKPIDLPSGTGVDLHLGMTLNLDQLLEDLADFDRLKSGQTANTKPSAPVTSTPDTSQN
ncbi:MAG: YdbH domain-containing protein, partial [Asticcacaulis sp.]